MNGFWASGQAIAISFLRRAIAPGRSTSGWLAFIASAIAYARRGGGEGEEGLRSTAQETLELRLNAPVRPPRPVRKRLGRGYLRQLPASHHRTPRSNPLLGQAMCAVLGAAAPAAWLR